MEPVMSAVPAQPQPGHRSSKGCSRQMRLKGCLFQTVGQGCCRGNLSGVWHRRALGRSLAPAWEAAGTQVPRPEQLPPLSDKERLVVFSLFPQHTRQSPSPFSLLCLLSLLFPFFLLGLWSGIGFAGRMTEAGSALRHRRGWGGGAQRRGQGWPQCSLFPWACVIHGLAWPGRHRAWLSALTLIMVYLSDCPSHNSPGPLITEGGGTAADWSPAWIQPRAQWHHIFIYKSQRWPPLRPLAGSQPLTPSILSSRITGFHFSYFLSSTLNWLKKPLAGTTKTTIRSSKYWQWLDLTVTTSG